MSSERDKINIMELRDGKSFDTTPLKRSYYQRRVSNSTALGAMLEDEEPPSSVQTPMPNILPKSTQSTPTRHIMSQRVQPLRIKELPKNPTPQIKRTSISTGSQQQQVTLMEVITSLVSLMWTVAKWMVKVPSRLLLLLPIVYFLTQGHSPESMTMFKQIGVKFDELRHNLTSLHDIHRLLKQVDRKATATQELLEELTLQVQLQQPVQYLMEEKKTLPSTNYASFSAGARIIRYAGMTSVQQVKSTGLVDKLLSISQPTNAYYNTKLHPPEIVLEQGQLEPGRCWHSDQKNGYLTIVLAKPVKLSKIQYVHIPEHLWSHDQAPDHIDVYALRFDPGMRERLQSQSGLSQVYKYVYDNFAQSVKNNSTDLFLGTMKDTLYPESSQVYDVVQLRFPSSKQTCLYQVHVQGVE